ncbi:molybdopterin-dependent oxidoreductase [Nocardia salmonicida]|uniref:molybdopterin-containing oxidoreductase family protein n=1 Tax=Nocardia salmonicida TaxID=53431 RepID=UPI00342BA8F6
MTASPVRPAATTPGIPRLDTVEKKTFCCICEASCGLIATVRDDRVISLAPDPDHPSSRGFACSKGVQFHEVVADPDRVVRPMQRLPDGSFVARTWDQALDDIGARLRAIRRTHGAQSIGVAYGNPVAWNFAGGTAIAGLAEVLGTKHRFSSASVDVNNYFAAADMLYGNTMVNPLPDYAHTDFAFLVGTNPVVSKGSLVTTGRIRDTLVAITRRGGRVIVLDPRRTETTRLFEHVPIRPNADPWLLGAMLRVLFDEDLVDAAAIARQTVGIDGLRALAGHFELDRAARESGVPVETIVSLARDLAAADSASVHGRCGASLGQFSTLTKFLLDALAIVTGNLDRRGGMVFGDPMVDLDSIGAKSGAFGRNRWHTRVHGIGEVNGTAPLACLAAEITTPGEGRLRALIGMSSNIVTSSPGSAHTADALDQLDLMVWLDPYITETSRHAHWILPPALFLEREEMPIFTQGQSLTPNAQWVAPVVPPRGQARSDAWIIDQIARRLGILALALPGGRLMAKLGLRIQPHTLIDLTLRIGKHGDRFGLRPKGLSRKKLMATQGAVKLADDCAVGVLDTKLFHDDHRVHLDQPDMAAETRRLLASTDDPRYPLRLFSIRTLRSHNTWLHNVPRLMSGGERRCHAMMSRSDAAAAGVHDRDPLTITSEWGQITVPVLVSDDIMDGTIGLTHGFGHGGGWRRAVAAGGANYNVLTPDDPRLIDQPSGNAFLNGIPVHVEPASAP